MIAIVLDFGKEFRDSRLCPVTADDWQNVTQDVGLGDGSVYVGDHNLVGPLPQVQVAAATGCALWGKLSKIVMCL